jgi:hypothetical protein
VFSLFGFVGRGNAKKSEKGIKNGKNSGTEAQVPVPGKTTSDDFLVTQAKNIFHSENVVLSIFSVLYPS